MRKSMVQISLRDFMIRDDGSVWEERIKCIDGCRGYLCNCELLYNRLDIPLIKRGTRFAAVTYNNKLFSAMYEISDKVRALDICDTFSPDEDSAYNLFVVTLDGRLIYCKRSENELQIVRTIAYGVIAADLIYSYDEIVYFTSDKLYTVKVKDDEDIILSQYNLKAIIPEGIKFINKNRILSESGRIFFINQKSLITYCKGGSPCACVLKGEEHPYKFEIVPVNIDVEANNVKDISGHFDELYVLTYDGFVFHYNLKFNEDCTNKFTCKTLIKSNPMRQMTRFLDGDYWCLYSDRHIEDTHGNIYDVHDHSHAIDLPFMKNHRIISYENMKHKYIKKAAA